MPVRGAAPTDTRLMSCNSTGTPSLVFNAMCSMSGTRLNQADAADDHRLLAAADERAAGVAIVRLHRLGDVGDRQFVLLERERVDFDLILLDQRRRR